MDDSLRCTACGVQAEAKCSCRKPYDYIPAHKAAALALTAHPDWSDRRLAEAIGVSDQTIGRTRKASPTNVEDKKRIRKDGRAFGPRKRKVKNPPEIEAKAAALVIDHGLTLAKAAAESGINGSVQVMKTAVAKEEGRRERDADPVITPDMLSLSAQEKLEAAIRQRQRIVEAQFEHRVQTELRRRVEELVLPAFREEQEDAAFVIKSRKGIFREAEYNAILRCLHPDLNPTSEQKNEAFRLWHERKLALMSDKDDPRRYKPLPDVDAVMAARPGKPAAE
jgi:hypothetical protein